MSLVCYSCERTFSRRSAYSQHSQKCIKKVEVEEEGDVEMGIEGNQDDDVEMDIEGNQDNDDYENNNIEVIVLCFLQGS